MSDTSTLIAFDLIKEMSELSVLLVLASSCSCCCCCLLFYAAFRRRRRQFKPQGTAKIGSSTLTPSQQPAGGLSPAAQRALMAVAVETFDSCTDTVVTSGHGPSSKAPPSAEAQQWIESQRSLYNDAMESLYDDDDDDDDEVPREQPIQAGIGPSSSLKWPQGQSPAGGKVIAVGEGLLAAQQETMEVKTAERLQRARGQLSAERTRRGVPLAETKAGGHGETSTASLARPETATEKRDERLERARGQLGAERARREAAFAEAKAGGREGASAASLARPEMANAQFAKADVEARDAAQLWLSRQLGDDEQAGPPNTQSRKGRQSSLALVPRRRAAVGVADGVPPDTSCKQGLSAPKKTKTTRAMIEPATLHAQQWLANAMNDVDDEDSERSKLDEWAGASDLASDLASPASMRTGSTIARKRASAKCGSAVRVERSTLSGSVWTDSPLVRRPPSRA